MPQQLPYATVAYAIMFYIAGLVLVVGVVARIVAWRRQLKEHPAQRAARPRNRGMAAGALFLDLFLFRGEFFEDRLAWLFSMMFHYGLLLVLLRHLRYVIEPAWVGPLWQVVEIAQPFGLYGGLVMMAGIVGFALRRLLVADLRRTSTLLDYTMLAVLLAVPAAGYLNAFAHPDILQVKWFFLGLLRFHWQPLPHAPLLLLHLWLVAALLMLLPFSELVHLGGISAAWIAPTEAVARPQRRNLRRAALTLIVLTLAIPAATAGTEVLLQPSPAPAPDFATLIRAHRTDDPSVMIRYHPALLYAHRYAYVHQGARQSNENIERCVTCHAVMGPNDQPVGFGNSKHFCVDCHTEVAVKVDCFDCHNSMPTNSATAGALHPDVSVKNTLAYYLARVKLQKVHHAAPAGKAEND